APNVWVPRCVPGRTGRVWSRGGSAAVQTIAGPLSADGDELCALGSFGGAVTLFGTALPAAGGYDAWVARFAANGTPKFVRAIGSAGAESSFGRGSIAATTDGGCAVLIASGADLSIDGFTLPVSAGPAVLLKLDAGGTVRSAARLAATAQMVQVGDRLYAAGTV